MSGSTHPIPRTVWILWHQGLDKAPLVVQKCVESWIKENPCWDVVVLDAESLKKYVTPDLPPEKLATLDLTKQSNLIRLQLLSDYGGVWADATLLCLRPLDEWIDECTASGFFAFAFPDGSSRVLSTWFLASQRQCPIVVKWRQRYASFLPGPQPGQEHRTGERSDEKSPGASAQSESTHHQVLVFPPLSPDCSESIRTMSFTISSRGWSTPTRNAGPSGKAPRRWPTKSPARSGVSGSSRP